MNTVILNTHAHLGASNHVRAELPYNKRGIVAHTPGPWKLYPPGSIIGHSKQAVVKQPGAFDWIASVQCSNVPNWEDNAVLIAAAPELLAVAQGCLAYFQIEKQCSKYVPAGWLKDLEAAIDKATQ